MMIELSEDCVQHLSVTRETPELLVQYELKAKSE